jgi:hypothetical protein
LSYTLLRREILGQTSVSFGFYLGNFDRFNVYYFNMAKQRRAKAQDATSLPVVVKSVSVSADTVIIEVIVF